MKKEIIIILLCCLSFQAFSTDNDTTKVATKSSEIVKKGYNFGPFPVIGFDADKGFGFGALLNIYNFGDGSTYPNPKEEWYMEASYFTKGTQLYLVSFDSKTLIPNIRTSISAFCMIDNALQFAGFNGYMSHYDYERVNAGVKDPNLSFYNPYYRVGRAKTYLKADFTGKITDDGRLQWIAGYHFTWDKYSDMNIDGFNSNLDDNKKYDTNAPTLFGQYKEWGIIPEELHNGGITSSIRAGLTYDSRDIENNPGKGICATAQLIAAPEFLGSTQGYYKYSLNYKQYIPIVYQKLTFAYRLLYQGTIGNSIPFYAMPAMNEIGKNYDKDAIGGYRTARGIMRNRVNALDMGFYNAELRWKFIEFRLWKQNIAFALSAFTDGAMSIRPYDLSFQAKESDFENIAAFNASKAAYDTYIKKGDKEDSLHLTYGGGLRFIMNNNFILAAEAGMPVDKRDGNFCFYLSIGFAF